MKKLFKSLGLLSMGMAVSFVMFSCSSVDGLLDDYEKACKEGDVEKAAKCCLKLEKKADNKKLTEEQDKRWSKLIFDCNIDDEEFEKAIDKLLKNEKSDMSESEFSSWENDDDDYDNDDDF